jgi:hypothetical protein
MDGEESLVPTSHYSIFGATHVSIHYPYKISKLSFGDGWQSGTGGSMRKTGSNQLSEKVSLNSS